MTFDDTKMLRQFLENDGVYPGDPQAASIHSYFSPLAHDRVFHVRMHKAGNLALAESDMVHRPILLWSHEAGLTEAGKEALARCIQAEEPPWIQVDSSNIEAYRYERARRLLFVRFKGGSVYSYLEVQPEIFDQLFCEKESKGKFINKIIKPTCTAVKIEDQDAAPIQ